MYRTSRSGRRYLLAAALIALSATSIAAVDTPASGAESDQRAETVAALETLGLLTDGGTGSGEVASATGLKVEVGGQRVALRPDTSFGGRLTEDKNAVVYSDPRADYAYAVTGQGAAANAGYVVIHDPAAPQDFQFTIGANGQPAELEATPAGGVLVRDSAGTILNTLRPAWAIDAGGRSVPTSYSIDGDLVVQHVDHEGAAYPVVADPRLACDPLWCTLELTRTETTVVSQGGGAAIACGGLGPAGPICAALLLGASAMASIALANNQCIGVRSARALIPSTTHMVYVACYA
ncbi:hypothetical protein [uncultured Leifsonia sp.]|uniref:hypothetical protein n=1 Tax=uncultured Leifsonia sp. TaxID=340359 RepID=UPI0028D08FB3|nr:hypothetical protein [uncultured Leifsonia sp.]